MAGYVLADFLAGKFCWLLTIRYLRLSMCGYFITACGFCSIRRSCLVFTRTYSLVPSAHFSRMVTGKSSVLNSSALFTFLK